MALALAISLLVINTSNAVSLHGKARIDPDVFGPEGEDYINNNTNIDVDQIGIDYLAKKKSGRERCDNGHLAEISWIGSLEDGRVVTDSL